MSTEFVIEDRFGEDNTWVVKPSRKPPRQLTPAEKQAIVAACMLPKAHKGQIAKDFNVRPETISRILREVKQVQNVANPLQKGAKPQVIAKSYAAIMRALDDKLNLQDAGKLGVRCLEGTGEFITGPGVNIDQSNNIVFAWSAPVEPQDVVDAHIIDESTTPVSG